MAVPIEVDGSMPLRRPGSVRVVRQPKPMVFMLELVHVMDCDEQPSVRLLVMVATDENNASV